MITTCLNYAGGIEELADMIRDTEDGSKAMEAIDQWVESYQADL